MINGEKIGVGIVTHKRRHTFEKCIKSLENCSDVDFIYVYEDGLDYSAECLKKLNRKDWFGNGSFENVGVGRAKNNILRHFMTKKYDHVFVFEDDIYVKDPSVFEKYIQASKASGIQHFNFSQHGVMNKTFDGTKQPNPRLTVSYKCGEISFYPHCVGAMSYYSKQCLETVGLIDERYWNACEHVDHTYEIIKAGLHPSFWYFADIDESWKYLGDEEWSMEKSTISSSPNHQQMMKDADKIFVEKHGHLPVQTPQDQIGTFLEKLKEIKNKYGSNNNNLQLQHP